MRAWRRKTWPALKKNARRQKRSIVFIGESGLSAKPARARTWAPRGQTPLLLESFGWKSLPIIGGLSLRRFHFQIHKGSIKGPQVAAFIRHLQRHIKQRILITWDGAAIHRSRLVADCLAWTKGKVRAERLPAYAPDLNPAECMRARLKSHEIANLITPQAWEPSFAATSAPRKMRRRPSIIAACFSQAELRP